MKELLICTALISAFVHCSSPPGSIKKDTEALPNTPVVSDSRTDLILSWFADGGSQVASSVSEVPETSRKEVRIQDPTVPPEKRDPRWIFIADLTKPDSNGHYPVRAALRAKYEAKRHKVVTRAEPVAPRTGVAGPAPPMSPSGKAPVVMYATRHCPVCIKARRWLLDKKIPYVEKDIERDPEAAKELVKKGQAQGVPTSGVPVFDVRGRLLPGFDPATILKLLVGDPKPQTTI